MIRAKISTKLTGDLIHIVVEWIDVVDNQPGDVKFKEEFKLSKDRPACAYVSRVALAEARVEPGTFWLDEQGLRHFNMAADQGQVDSIGCNTEIKFTGVI